jgi:quinol monooxygenase YgiN
LNSQVLHIGTLADPYERITTITTTMSESGLPNTFCTIDPTFTILTDDESKIDEMCQQLIDVTKKETGVMYYGFVKNDTTKTLTCCEAYKDGDAVNAHFDNVGPLLGSALEQGLVKLERIIIHGPKTEILKTKSKADPLGALYYELIDPSITSFQSLTNEDTPAAPTTGTTMCHVVPHFTVLDETKFDPVPFVELTKSETGCIDYGFTKSEDGTKLFCREAYKDSKSVLEHLDNVGPTLTSALENGVLKLDSLAVYGPQSEVEKCKDACDSLGATYHYTTTQGTIERYSLVSGQ